jgi:hypothetical protein
MKSVPICSAGARSSADLMDSSALTRLVFMDSESRADGMLTTTERKEKTGESQTRSTNNTNADSRHSEADTCVFSGIEISM